LTQVLYAAVFVSRYLDLFTAPPYLNFYNFVFKVTYIVTSFYLLFLMIRVFPRSHEREKQWIITAYILGFSAVATPIFQAIFRNKTKPWSVVETFWTFSIVLESLAVVPQLTLLAHTSVPTVITSYYLVALGSYRALYILNWIWRGLDKSDRFFEPVAVIFGLLQTLLYIEFAWIYWRRQKVKLRNGGGVLDGEEFARGLVLGRLIGRPEEDKAGGRTGGGWRGGGLSVSADDFEVGEGDEEAESGDEIEHEEGDVERGLISERAKTTGDGQV
jgi:hypothetical protein